VDCCSDEEEEDFPRDLPGEHCGLIDEMQVDINITLQNQNQSKIIEHQRNEVE
jgi:hypothetical protein